MFCGLYNYRSTWRLLFWCVSLVTWTRHGVVPFCVWSLVCLFQKHDLFLNSNFHACLLWQHQSKPATKITFLNPQKLKVSFPSTQTTPVFNTLRKPNCSLLNLQTSFIMNFQKIERLQKFSSLVKGQTDKLTTTTKDPLHLKAGKPYNVIQPILSGYLLKVAKKPPKQCDRNKPHAGSIYKESVCTPVSLSRRGSNKDLSG